MEIISRNEAKERGLTRFFTGKPCLRGHVGERHTCSGSCVVCLQNKLRTLRKIPGTKVRAGMLKYRAAYRLRRNPEVVRRAKRKYNKGPGKIAIALRKRIHTAVKKGRRSGSAVGDLGCSIEAFKAYIAKQFHPEMTWENWGKWHLDHIRPLASFDLTDREQFLQACHYTNYQPLWAADNIRKWAHFSTDDQRRTSQESCEHNTL